jgi:hypothetical protein
MRKLDLSVCLFCAVAFAPCVLPAQQGTTTNVTIRVTDAIGAVIPHAQIRFVPPPDPVPPNLETDDHGERGVDLRAGSYALSVSARGFRTYARHIDVKVPGEQFSISQFVPVVLEVGHTDGPSVDSKAAEGSLLLTADPYHLPVTLSPSDFHALPHTTITVHNGHTNAAETYSGIPLATLLEKVNTPLGKELHGEAMTSYVVATGSDGYSVVLSLAEIDPEFHAGQVLVADTRDGQPLANNGPFQLIVSDDKRPARWVHNLVSITLQRGR